ncbi:MAG TPA: cyclic nucleotide-binding domain-containing protein [Hyphomicrobium sp.]|jgi:CRP/FNR family transcriptional regulator, cyclic AMP receptor protein|nr:cyclic nucleotide-binding domain-containing protein [Hyphomicrobium sp.]
MAAKGFDFDLLASGGFPLQSFAVNAKIFVQDDPGTCMYVVRSGRVGILSGGAVLENIGPNGTFGEMALIDGAPRSATAIAREPTEVAVIDEKAFLYLVEKNPAFALDLLRRLTARLRRTTENL